MARVTLIELLDHMGIDYKRQGNGANIVCPFCDTSEKTKRNRTRKLHFNFDKDTWICPICHLSGGVLAFYSRYMLGQPLPSDSRELSQISIQMQRYVGSPPSKTTTASAFQSTKEIPSLNAPAPDDILHQVYTCMLSMPELALSKEHKENLLKRGLSPESIERNMYRTLPGRCPVPPEIQSIYEIAGGDKRKAELLDGGYPYPKPRVLVGLYIARFLQERGYSLKGVPGFFRFGDHWCLKYSPGLLIPTRNHLGQIVVFQVRTSGSSSSKYLTLSCSGLPDAVSDSISRCHFPLRNAPLSGNIVLILTEGPLKADVAIANMEDKNIAFVAIQGVQNTKDLYSQIPLFREYQIKSIYNALDMDRLTNPNVWSGEAQIRATFREHGMEMRNLYWGEECARRHLQRFTAFTQLFQIPCDIPAEASVFEALAITSTKVVQAGFNLCEYRALDGSKYSHYWESNTKGIDDCLTSGSCDIRW